MPFTATITPQQTQFIVNHKDDRPRTYWAEQAGVSVSTFYRVIRRHGATMDRSLNSPNLRARTLAEKYYPTMSSREIGEQFHVNAGRIRKYARALGIEHTDDTAIRLYNKSRSAAMEGFAKTDHAKQGRKQHALWRQEYWRQWEGKPQLTRLHLATLPRRIMVAKWRLRTVWRYEDDPDDNLTMLITSGTRRTPREHLFAKRYGIKFITEPSDVPSLEEKEI